MSIEPLDTDLRKLLDAEAEAPLPANIDEIQRRVQDNVRARIDPPDPENPPDPGDPGAPLPDLSPGLHPTAWLVGGLVAGGIAGWLAHAYWVVPIEIIVEVPIEVPIEVPVEVPAEPEPVEPTPAAPTPEPVEPPPPDAPKGLDALPERAVIDQARVALRRARPADAMVALMNHSRRFGDGQLVEERDRLTIEALVALGRVPEAKSKAEQFKAAYPSSIHMPAIDAAIGE